uniref:Uncharacterized protein n=1 Tax=Ananas comosus var. bracteatus TaxID=296719 RepID=A0A6V7P995_ANACO|nr:unnamed protein product [Ananas comosus var. bracteatus]
MSNLMGQPWTPTWTHTQIRVFGERSIMLPKPRAPSRGVLFLLLRRPQRSLSSTITITITITITTSSAIAEAPPSFVVEEYLVSSCGLSPSAASKASRSLAHLKSPHKPDSVIRFLRSRGFDEPCLRKLLSRRPILLCSDVDKTLAPKLRAFEDLGFRSADLLQILFTNPRIFHLSLDRTILPRIRLLVGVVGSVDLLAKILKRSNRFLTSSHGAEDSPQPRVPSRLRLVGYIPPYPQALWVLHFVSKAKLKGKLDCMKSFGWTEAQFLAAFQKSPAIVMLSEKTMSAKMEFFVKEAGFEPSLIARHPDLLKYSLDNRIIPRHRVLLMRQRVLELQYIRRVDLLRDFMDLCLCWCWTETTGEILDTEKEYSKHCY